MSSALLTVKKQFINSPIFDLEEEEKTLPFEFQTKDLRKLAPRKENYGEAKKIGVLLMMMDGSEK